MMRGTGLKGRGTVASRRQAVTRGAGGAVLSHAVSRWEAGNYIEGQRLGNFIGHPRKCQLVYSAAMVVLIIMFVSVAAALCCAVLFWRRRSRRVGAPPQRATYEVLHTASHAVSVLRDGLTQATAVKAAPSLRQLLGTPTVAIADQGGVLACHGSDQHAEALGRHLRGVVTSGRSQVLSA